MPFLEIHDNGLYGGIGPHPSFVQVAKPFIFEQTVQQCLRAAANGGDEAREVSSRLQGVQWIDGVRKALHLPVRTFMTAVVYYHRFRLAHADADFVNVDAAAAALFTACKIEDTLKKSRDILCAAHNLKAAPAEHLTPDDAMFEDHSKRILGLERLMLESSGFDFRNRNPQQWVIKFTRLGELDRDTVGKTAYRICLDVYRTYGPLKQTSSSIGLACVELAARLHEASIERLEQRIGDNALMASKWGTSRAEVMETLLDLLELYTHSRNATVVGPEHAIETFIAIRITLNKEAAVDDLPRFTEFVAEAETEPEQTKPPAQTANGGSTAKPSPTSPHSAPQSAPRSARRSPSAPAAKSKVLERRDGTIRYMLDSARAHDEKEAVDAHFKEEWEEYEEVIERPARKAEPAPRRDDPGEYRRADRYDRAPPGGREDHRGYDGRRDGYDRPYEYRQRPPNGADARPRSRSPLPPREQPPPQRYREERDWRREDRGPLSRDGRGERAREERPRDDRPREMGYDPRDARDIRDKYRRR